MSSASATQQRFFFPMHCCEIREDTGLKRSYGGEFGIVRTKSEAGKIVPKVHQGVDLFAPSGTPVFSIAKGKCRVANSPTGYGKQVILEFKIPETYRRAFDMSGRVFSNNTAYVLYAHLSEIYVCNGSEVEAGMVLGKTGSTGNGDSRYPHLHFELRNVAQPPANGTLSGRLDPSSVFHFKHRVAC